MENSIRQQDSRRLPVWLSLTVLFVGLVLAGCSSRPYHKFEAPTMELLSGTSFQDVVGYVAAAEYINRGPGPALVVGNATMYDASGRVFATENLLTFPWVVAEGEKMVLYARNDDNHRVVRHTIEMRTYSGLSPIPNGTFEADWKETRSPYSTGKTIEGTLYAKQGFGDLYVYMASYSANGSLVHFSFDAGKPKDFDGPGASTFSFYAPADATSWRIGGTGTIK